MAIMGSELVGWSYLRALVFLLLRLRRRTRFFLHFALIFAQLSCENVSTDPKALWKVVGAYIDGDGEVDKRVL